MKPAKEQIQEAKATFKGWARDDLYIFTEEQLNDLCTRLCYEQRYACQYDRTKDTMQDEDGNWYVSCENVLNEEMPDLFD
jgi:hypothetical protein